MHPSSRPKLSRLYQFAAAALVINALVCLNSLSRVSRGLHTVVETRANASAIALVSDAIKNAEVTVRSYLLSGGDHDFAKLGKSILKVQPHLDDLARRARGNPIFETRVISLAHVIRERTDRLFEVAKLRKQGSEDAVKALNSVQGARTSAEVNRLITELEAEEDRRLLDSETTVRGSMGTTLLTLIFASILALTLLGLVFWLTCREMTCREDAGEAIREREEWFSATLASISDAVIATDDKGFVRLINRAAQRLTGWTLDESKGKPLADVFALLREESRTPVESPFQRVIREGASVGVSNHTLLVARDGTEHPVEHSGAPIRTRDGSITGVVLSFRDVTDRHRSEAELRASKENADAANRAKDQFLAVLGHELRKPLTPILMSVSGALERDTASELGPTLEMIRRNVEMEVQLIDDLLDVARIARGGIRLRTEVIDVHEAIRRAVGMLHQETRDAGLEIILELSARRHHALADSTRITQVFLNLITNALKFTPSGGRLECRTWNEGFNDPGPDAGRLVLEFRDSGIGIDAEALTRIFEPFEQGGAEVARRYGGLGLGLAISRGIVEALGGQMSASSPGRGKGAVFHLALPLTSAPAPRVLALAPPPPEPNRPVGLKLLLVEDDPDSLRYLAFVLGSRGHQVVAVSNLAEARACLAQNRIDLLISDIELPDGSGLDLIRDHPGLLGIAVSGFGSDEDVRASETAGFTVHLSKPIALKTLENAIARVMSRPRRHSS